MISKQAFVKVAGAAFISLGLTACNTTTGQLNPAAVGTAAGAIIGAAASTDKSNYERGIYTAGGALIGNVIGSALTPAPNPCATRQTGTVTETNGRRSQTQSTQYECNYRGRPTSARSPQFQ